MEVLQGGDAVPHFAVRDQNDGVFDYSTIWQRRNLLLVLVGSTEEYEQYLSELVRHTAAFNEHESTLVITKDEIAGLPVPGLIVTDRWGEIVHLVRPKTINDLPAPMTLLQWLEAIEHRCPECEGEAK
jgi:hypothetical protein